MDNRLPIHLAGSTLDPPRHACAFFRTKEEEYRVLLPFILEGMGRGEKALPSDDDAVTCTYDLAKFGAGVVMDALRTHRLVVIGGFLHENPYFVPPHRMLEELRGRETASPVQI